MIFTIEIMKLRIKQFFCWHEYADKDVRGYDTPKPGAVCLKCGGVSK